MIIWNLGIPSDSPDIIISNYFITSIINITFATDFRNLKWITDSPHITYVTMAMI
jgi:hypothetical protein